MTTTTETPSWPSREEWQAAAEHDVRAGYANYPDDFASRRLDDYTTADERAELVAAAKRARSALFRIAKQAATEGSPLPSLSDVIQVRDVVRRLNNLADRHNQAAEQTVNEAVAAEIANRATEEGWQKHLAYREYMDDYLKQAGLR